MALTRAYGHVVSTTYGLVAFDMAGTTIDEGELVYAVLRRVTTDAGADYDDATFTTHMGTEKRGAVRDLLAAGGVDADAELVDEVHGRFVTELAAAYRDRPPVPMPGIVEAFTALRSAGVKVALTTGFDRPTTTQLLEALEWTVGETVDLVVCATEVAAGRPAPDMIQYAMTTLGVDDPTRVIAVGDTPADLLAADAAGVVRVGVLTGAADRDRLAVEPHDHVLASAAEVLALIPDLPRV